jgi:hypothetical protein
VLATLYACFVWKFLTIVPSGMLLLALIVGTFAIATWATTPISLVSELNQTPRGSLMPGAPLVIVATVLIACVHIDTSFSMLSARLKPRFEFAPPELSAGFLAGFLAIVATYPYLKLEMEPEKATLIGAVIGFATYTLWANLWIALPVTVVVRYAYLAWIFYASKQLARASCPAIPNRLC